MDTIYAKLAEFIEAGETTAVATIVSVKGSVPREVGAKMIIHPLGQHVGTVGGGCGEADVIRAALDVLQTGEPTTVRVDLTEDVSMQALGVCGGIMDVFVEQVGSQTRFLRETRSLRPRADRPPPPFGPGSRAGRPGHRGNGAGSRSRGRDLARPPGAGRSGTGGP